jgi:saccharopine dehydrogenase-like NADP-dependent oxidoreductase
MLYELRQYKVKSGKMKQWVKLAEEQIIPFQTSHGMVVPGSFTAVKDTRMFVWLRRFKNEAERTRLYKKVYESEHWKNVIKPQIDLLLDVPSIVVTDMVPTGRSVLQ